MSDHKIIIYYKGKVSLYKILRKILYIIKVKQLEYNQETNDTIWVSSNMCYTE